MTTNITREAYMKKEITHQQFFGHIAQECNLPTFGAKFMKRVKEALVNDDVHLNTIPLKEWDNMVFHFSQRTKAIISKYDGGFSLAGGVCMLKEKARLQAEEESAKTCDGWSFAEHLTECELTQVNGFTFCPDCLDEYNMDKYEQDEYGS